MLRVEPIFLENRSEELAGGPGGQFETAAPGSGQIVEEHWRLALVTPFVASICARQVPDHSMVQPMIARCGTTPGLAKAIMAGPLCVWVAVSQIRGAGMPNSTWPQARNRSANAWSKPRMSAWIQSSYSGPCSR